MAAVIPLESAEQILFFNMCALQEKRYPGLRWVYAVPNGGSRNVIEARNLVLQGVRSGVPDVMCPVPVGAYHGWYGELKRIDATECKVSKEQKSYLEYLRSVGYRAEWHKGGEAMFEDLRRYLKGEL